MVFKYQILLLHYNIATINISISIITNAIVSIIIIVTVIIIIFIMSSIKIIIFNSLFSLFLNKLKHMVHIYRTWVTAN